MVARRSAGTGIVRRTTLAPLYSPFSSTTLRPYMWNSGRKHSATSVSGSAPPREAYDWAVDSRFSWVVRTPFGSPVVPEVYGWTATSSKVRSGRSNSGEAAPTCSS